MACFTSRDTFVNPVLKYFLFSFNFLFWLAGLIVLGFGLWAHLEREKFSFRDFRSVFDFLSDVSIFFIIIGLLIFCIAFFGCLGALRENTCLLKLYYYSILVIFLAVVGLGVYIFLKSNQFKDEFIKTLTEELVPLYTERADKRDIVDWFQKEFECCGMSDEGYKDWNNNQYYNCTEDNKSPLSCAVPYSCCIKYDTIYKDIPNAFCGADALNPKKKFATSNIRTEGCVMAVMLSMQNNLPMIGFIVFAVSVPQILGVMLSRTLEGQIQDQLVRWRRINNFRV